MKPGQCSSSLYHLNDKFAHQIFMDIRLIKTGTIEYGHMINLRMKVLLEPVGIPRSYINPQKESNDLLIGAFEKDQLVG